jgi:CUG-BP- and ETR3-like factor
MNIIPQVAIFQEIFNQEKHYYFNYATNQSQYEPPPPGSMVYRMDGTYYYQVDTSTENLNDMTAFQKTPGPPGANLFVFHLPNNMSKSNHNTEDSELHGLFKKFGNILSARVMTKDGKSKGFGFVSFDNSKSATDAIEEMNGLEISGKRLKVELKKGNENSAAQPTNSLKQVNFNPL